jgi:hypothetical protein
MLRPLALLAGLGLAAWQLCIHLPGELELLHQGQTHLDANSVWPGVELMATWSCEVLRTSCGNSYGWITDVNHCHSRTESSESSC